MHRQNSIGLVAAVLLAAAPGEGRGQSIPPNAQTATARRPPAATAVAAGEESKAAQLNNWTVGIVGGFFEGTFIRLAVELAKALDDGENLRVLPIVSYGGNENVNDLLYLKGVDVAITYTDTLALYKRSGQIRNIEQRVNYISELLVGELYVLARPEIKTLKDLDGKKVSLGIKGGSATTTGPILFERVGIQPNLIYISNTIAVEKMRSGEVDAIVSTGGKPNDLFVKMKPEPGFHFLAVEWSDKFADYYLPCPLSHEDYPLLIAAGESVPTLCMQAVLAVYNFPRSSDRFRRVERFIEYYFERFDKLKQPSFQPKWKEINLAANVPGWTRYWLAAEKLAALRKTAANDSARPRNEQEVRFQEFLTWREKQGKKP
jgi:NMT1 family protein